MYVLMYEYDVDAAKRAEFGQVYGSNGKWSDLFRVSPGYLGTDLYRSVGETESRYFVIDRWAGEESFADFQASWGTAYERFGEQTRDLYRTETVLGSFPLGSS